MESHTAETKVRRTRREVRALLRQVKTILQDLYGDRLDSVILYGSFARDEADGDSDIDIAVVLQGNVNTTEEANRIQDAIYDVTLEAGELVCVYPVSASEFATSPWPLYHHIKNEGIRL